MQDLSTSLLLLVLALLLLWLAVTDRLSRILDAWDVVTGKSTVTPAASSTSSTTASAVGSIPKLPVLSLPSIPSNATNVQVGIS